MDKVIDCIYENGIFKPLKRVPIKEGQEGQTASQRGQDEGPG